MKSLNKIKSPQRNNSFIKAIDIERIENFPIKKRIAYSTIYVHTLKAIRTEDKYYLEFTDGVATLDIDLEENRKSYGLGSTFRILDKTEEIKDITDEKTYKRWCQKMEKYRMRNVIK